MQIRLHKITVRDLTQGYEDNAENGVRAYGGRLDVRPPYQREFVYKDKQRDAVIDTLTRGFPLNVMYWSDRGDGTYEIIDGQQRTIYWNTVLYVDPRYEGRGYGAIVIGQMVEVYGDDYFDLDAVPASVENLKFAGLQVDYVNQYVLGQKHIQTTSLRGKLVATKEAMRICKAYGSLRSTLSSFCTTPYALRYVSYIDDVTYSFIQQHSRNDIFLRSQDMFNWILTYPFGQESPLLNRVQNQCAFSSTQEVFRFYAVQVYVEGQLVGIYIVRRKRDELYLNYLYYSLEYEDVVFQSIAEHIFNIRPIRLFTAHKKIADYLCGLHIFAHNRVYKKSFSHPASFVYDPTQFIQAGDGDNIA